MADFTETMRLREKAEEDIYFAKRDRELIKARQMKQARRHPPEATDLSEEGHSDSDE